MTLPVNHISGVKPIYNLGNVMEDPECLFLTQFLLSDDMMLEVSEVSGLGTKVSGSEAVNHLK